MCKQSKVEEPSHEGKGCLQRRRAYIEDMEESEADKEVQSVVNQERKKGRGGKLVE